MFTPISWTRMKNRRGISKHIGQMSTTPYATCDRGVVQLVERMHGVHEVVGSSPAAPTNHMNNSSPDIAAILERNKRVEMDKAWEISLTRRAFIALLTYATTAILLWLNGLSNPLLQALIPAVAYLVSTLSLPWLKKRWIEKQ